MASDVLAEALCRIEHKLDLLLDALDLTRRESMNSSRYCPICMIPVEYQIDVAKQVVIRKCGCGTGKFPPSISFNNPIIPSPLTAIGKKESE